jgi:hypothetical protein
LYHITLLLSFIPCKEPFRAFTAFLHYYVPLLIPALRRIGTLLTPYLIWIAATMLALSLLATAADEAPL